MTCAKGDPDGWTAYDRDRAEEARIKARFRAMHDPLKVLIVTAKLLTGFDAPIEGVMYLDKPLREHNLFQALARTNRRWTNTDTGQEMSGSPRRSRRHSRRSSHASGRRRRKKTSSVYATSSPP